MVGENRSEPLDSCARKGNPWWLPVFSSLLVAFVAASAWIVPLTISTDELAAHFYDKNPIASDERSLRLTKDKTTEFLRMVAKTLEKLSASEAVDLNSFRGCAVQIGGNDAGITVFGPVRDLYGLPLLPAGDDSGDQDVPKLSVSFANDRYSFGCMFRSREIMRGKEACLSSLKAQIGDLKRTASMVVPALAAVILALFVIVGRFSAPIGKHLAVICCVASLPLLFLVMFPGSYTGSGTVAVDPGRLTPLSRQRLQAEFVRRVDTLQTAGKLAPREASIVKDAVMNPGYEFPPEFFLSRAGAGGLSYSCRWMLGKPEFVNPDRSE